MTADEPTPPVEAERGDKFRTRGTSTGLMLFLLGVWGGVVPFIGSYFSFGYTLDHSWTAARVWLEVLPGAAVALGGLVLIWCSHAYRVALAGAGLSIIGGAWFVVGTQLAVLLHLGSVGLPAGRGEGRRDLESLAYFSGLGALVILLAAIAAGRLSMRHALAKPVEAHPEPTREDLDPTREDQRRQEGVHFVQGQGGEPYEPAIPRHATQRQNSSVRQDSSVGDSGAGE